MAANNIPSPFSFGDIGQSIAGGAKSGLAAISLSMAAFTANAGLEGTPLGVRTTSTSMDGSMADAERGVLDKIREVPRWVQEEQQRVQFQNQRFGNVMAKIHSEMPPVGTKPTDAVLRALHQDLGEVFEAAGSSPSADMLATEASVSGYINTAEAAQHTEPSYEQPTHAETTSTTPHVSNTSDKENSGGVGSMLFAGLGALAAAPVARTVVASVTQGGFAKAPAGKPAATVAATAKTTVAASKVPPKKGPGGPAA